jgi:hypothetical protein
VGFTSNSSNPAAHDKRVRKLERLGAMSVNGQQ